MALTSRSMLLLAGFFAAWLMAPVAVAQPVGGTEVSVATDDLATVGLELPARLWMPAQPRGGVVLVHAAGGWSDFREGHYGRALSAAGFAVLAIDSFGPRGITQTGDDQSRLDPVQMTRDALAARRALVARGITSARIAVMGFSKGGIAAYYAVDRNFLPSEDERFAAALIFYPPCNVRPRVARPAAPIYMALGEKDDFTGVRQCQELARGVEAAGGRLTVKIYPGAAHAFDGSPDNTAMIYLRFAETYTRCDVLVEADGRATFEGKSYALNDGALMGAMRQTCIRKGASIWTDLRQKEAATRDAVEFLSALFPR